LNRTPFCPLNGTQCIFGHDATDGPGREAGLHHFSIRVDNKIGRMDDSTSVFPVGSYPVGILGDFESVADWEGGARSSYHFFGFVKRIDG
jgi:hypothetical protein